MSAKESIAKIYIGYFGRSPEPKGFDYWISEMNRDFTELQVAASFSVQDEAEAKYPYLANPNVAEPGPFIDQVYLNLFNRKPDPEGKTYWENELNEAQGDPDAVGAMILNIINGARNTEEGQDLTTIQNKMDVALDWVHSVAEIPEFEYEGNSEAKASAKSVVEEVDDTDASVAEGKAETDAYVAGGQSGQSFTLTREVDAVQDFTGTNHNDTYFATGETLNTGDQLDGAGGRDTLSIQAGSSQQIAATPRMQGIEEIEIQGGANDLAAQFDFTTSSDVEMGTLTGVSGTVEFIGVGYPFDLKVENSSTPTPSAPNEATTSLFVGYNPQTVTGEDDVQKLELVNSGLAKLSIGGIEHVEVSATGLNYVSNFSASKSLTVEGTGNLWTSYSASDQPISFDSTGSSGNMNVSFSSKFDVNARGGSGNDVFDFSSTQKVDVESGDGDDFLVFVGRGALDENDIVDAGDGKDTLVANNDSEASAALVNALEGLEVLQFQQAFTSLDASEYTEVDEFVFNGMRTSGWMDVTGVQSEDTFVFSARQMDDDNLLSFRGENVGETLNLELRSYENGTFQPSGEAVVNGITYIYVNDGSESNGDQDDYATAILLDDNISAVTINSTGTNAFANGIIASPFQDGKHVAFGNEDGPSSFTLTGDHDLTIGAWIFHELNNESDNYGFADAVNVDATAFEADLKIALSEDDDVFSGGSGSDLIFGLDGDDKLTGNDGADQFRFVGKEGTDTITDFLVEEDQIGLNYFDFRSTSSTYEGTVLDENDYVENRDGITDTGTADNYKVIELQDALSADQIATDEGANIKAYVLVHNSTTERAELWYDADWSTADGRSQTATFDNIVDLAGVQDFTHLNFVEFV